MRIFAGLLAFGLSVGAHAQELIAAPPLELTIHMHWPRAQGYDESLPVEQAARAMTGIHLRDDTAGQSTKNYTDAFDKLLARRQLPDIVGGQRLKDHVNLYGPEGLYLPLDELVRDYAPNIQKFLDDHPELRPAITAWDGQIYYIPYFPDGEFGRAYFIRQDWLDKLGLPLPQTVDELYQTLVAFRDRDPNGNGEADEIPIFMRQWQELLRLVTLWDGRSTGSDTYHDFVVIDGEITHPYVTGNYRDGIKHLAQWHREGLIDPEIFTRGSKARDILLGENRGGMTHDWFASTAGYNQSLADQINGFNFAAILPPASVTGNRIAEHRRTPVKPDGWAISYNNEHPIKTIRYFDFWFSEPGRRLANFGIEGEQFELVDGRPVFKSEILRSGEPVNRQLYAIGAQIPRGFPQDYAYELQWTSAEALAGIELYAGADVLVGQFLGVALNRDEQDAYDFFWPEIRNHMLKRQRAWILGEGDIEADWASYMATLDELGLPDVLAAMRSAYARQYH